MAPYPSAFSNFTYTKQIRFMMGTSILLASSRQTFAFARDGALPFSSFIYKINPYTQTPVNAVWFATFIGYLIGFLAFAGPVAVGAVFSLGVGGQYIAYTIPIAARFVFENDFKPGPFSLGRAVCPLSSFSLLAHLLT
jgi:amino acid transporter